MSTLGIAYMFRHLITKNKEFLRQRQGLNIEQVSKKSYVSFCCSIVDKSMSSNLPFVGASKRKSTES